MSYSNSESYEFCKECYKQKQFCTCQEITEVCDQTISEHNPQCQSIGEQEQQQHQQQGGLEQEQGPQTQEQIQEGQRQGPQIQKQKQGPQTQGNQTQGPQTQGQIELQQQTQNQDQTEDQDQTQGPQLQAQRHGDQTMENNQTISTPVDVDGVNVNVTCGDCKPIIIPFDFFEKFKDKNHCDRGCDDMEKCSCQRNKENKCPDCDCCVQNLADLLNEVRQFQTTITVPADKQVDIYFSAVNGLVNPTVGQVITRVVDCSVLTFRPAAQTTIVPNTTVQLCDVAGICATDTDATPEVSNVFEFLFEQANNDQEDSTEKKKKPCTCPCCASGIGDELSCTANFGLLLEVFLKGQAAPLTPLYVLTVKDCLAYFVDNITTPTRICVFSLCAISGFRVVSQTI